MKATTNAETQFTPKPVAGLLLSVLLLLGFAAAARGQEAYAIEGEMLFRQYSPRTGELITDEQSTFKCRKNGTRWIITAVPVKTEPLKSVEAVFDGSRIDFTAYYRTSTPGQNDSERHHVRSSVPSRNQAFHASGPIWLDYLSGDYLMGFHTNRADLDILASLARNVYMQASAEHTKLPTEWRLSTNAPYLPLNVTSVYVPIQDPLKPHFVFMDASPTNCAYQVLSTTNVQGLSFPLRSQFRVFLPNLALSVVNQFEYDLRTKKIEVGAIADAVAP